MTNKDNNGFGVSTNGQLIPRMQEIASSVGGTRGATIPPLQPAGQDTDSGTGSSGSTEGSGTTGSS